MDRCDKTHDFAFEVRTQKGPVFSVGNAGHVLIGIQGVDGEGVEINKDLPDLELYSLYVARGIRTERVRVDVAADNDWADYVFEDGYDLMALSEVEKFIALNGHLPGVPSAQQVTQDGVDLAEMNKILLEKIEELTLHVIRLEKEIDDKN